MPSSFSDILRFEKQASGENDSVWGDNVNTVFEMIEDAIAGRAAVTHDDTANYTLTMANSATDEARMAILNIGGALSAARNVVAPTKSKVYYAKNATTGGYAATLKTSGGTGVSIPNGKSTVVLGDGTNMIDAIDYLSTLTVGSGFTVSAGTSTFSGAIAGSPANANVVFSPTGTGMVTINPATAGAMNNMVIGGSTPLAGTFTTLSATGNVTLGDAVTDAHRINGGVGVGVDAVTNAGILVQGTVTSGGVSQTGIESDLTCTTAATQDCSALAGRVRTPAASFTLPEAYGLYLSTAVIGSGSAITTQYGLYLQGMAGASTNWSIYADGTSPSYFGGQVLCGTTVTTGSSGGNTVLANASAYRFVNQAGTSSENYGTFSGGNSLQFNVPVATSSFDFTFAGTNRMYIGSENSGAGIFFIGEASADFAAPSTNNVVIYTKDNGSGKTQLVARFATGAVQQIAIEP